MLLARLGPLLLCYMVRVLSEFSSSFVRSGLRTNDGGSSFRTNNLVVSFSLIVQYSCPCFAFKEVAENVGAEPSTGWLYCLLSGCCGCGCCIQTVVSDEVAKGANIKDSDMLRSAACSCCWGPCFMCTTLHESRLLKEKTMAAPKENTMERI